jgi:hypothetical protein
MAAYNEAMARTAAVVACLLVLSTSLAAQQPPAPPMPRAAAAPATRVFASSTGLILNFIKADKAADFEAIVAKLKEALDNSANPVRKEMAASWRVYKSSDPGPAGSVLYVYFIDPTVKGADYSVTTILAEAFSAEDYAPLQKQYIEAYATGQNFVNLSLVADLGK